MDNEKRTLKVGVSVTITRVYNKVFPKAVEVLKDAEVDIRAVESTGPPPNRRGALLSKCAAYLPNRCLMLLKFSTELKAYLSNFGLQPRVDSQVVLVSYV